MPPALTAVEALDNAGHTAAGRHRRNACQSTRTPSRACRHARHRSLRVRPRALPPAHSRAAPARGWQHHVLHQRASVARLLPRSHGMSRSRRTLTRTPTRTAPPALTPILIPTRTLTLTGSPAAERSRPRRYLAYSTYQAQADAPALASAGTPADYTPLASRGTAAQHTLAPGGYNQQTGASNQPRHSRQLAQRERGVISGQGRSPEAVPDDQSAPTTPTPTPTTTPPPKTPGWAAAVQWALAAEKVLAAHPQP